MTYYLAAKLQVPLDDAIARTEKRSRPKDLPSGFWKFKETLRPAPKHEPGRNDVDGGTQ